MCNSLATAQVINSQSNLTTIQFLQKYHCDAPCLEKTTRSMVTDMIIYGDKGIKLKEIMENKFSSVNFFRFAGELQFRFKDKEVAGPVQEVCPWLDFINPEMILCKDGSLLAGFEFNGVDIENATDEHKNAVVNELQRAYQGFDNRDTLTWVFDKKRSYSYPENIFLNPISKRIIFRKNRSL